MKLILFFLLVGQVEDPPFIDEKVIQIILQEIEVLEKEKERVRRLPGCPIDPRMYWNLSCA
jgi:hypothetical protein